MVHRHVYTSQLQWVLIHGDHRLHTERLVMDVHTAKALLTWKGGLNRCARAFLRGQSVHVTVTTYTYTYTTVQSVDSC